MRVLVNKAIALILCAVFALSMSSCAIIDKGISLLMGASQTAEPKGDTDSERKPKDNAITLGIVELDTYNPLTTKSPTMKNMLGFMFEPLFALEDNSTPVPVLASSFTTSPDGRSISVAIKKDVLWHDMTYFSASDVVYTINTIINNETSYSHLLKDVVSASTLDGNTVNIVFSRSTPAPEALLSFPIIKNKSLTGEYKPIGTGPFMLDYDKLSAFSGYHGTKPELRRINIKSVPDNEKFISLFNASVIDIADSEMIDMSEYMPRSNAQVYNYYSNEMVFVGFNCADSVFNFPEARRSVSAVINRQEIASHIYFSRAKAANYPVNPDFAYYPKSKGNLATDNGTAEKILKDAGWKKDRRGVYFYSDNIGMTYFSVQILVNSEDKERLKAAAEISDAMTEMGMRNTVVSCKAEEFDARISAGYYDMFIGKTKLLPNNDLTDILKTGNVLNYSDSETDILLSQIGTLTAGEDKAAVYEKLFERIKTQSPIAPVCFLKDSLITSAKLKSGITPSMSGAVRATENWSLKCR